MSRAKGLSGYEIEQRRKAILNYIKANADADGYLTLKCSNYAKSQGIPANVVTRAVQTFAKQGILEFESMRKEGYLIHLLEKPTSPEKLVVPIKLEQLVCKKCGSVSVNQYAKFCWKCGASLRTEEEILKEDLHSAINKLYRLSDDSRTVNEIVRVITKVELYAFERERREN